MADEETTESVLLVDEDKQRRDWQQEMFEELGYQPEIARVFVDARVDWHDADTLLKKGWSLNHVLRVLL